MMDLICTRTPGVLVPFEGKGETEQLTRARNFSDQHHFVCLREGSAGAETLLDAIECILANPRSEPPIPVDIGGAGFTADWIANTG